MKRIFIVGMIAICTLFLIPPIHFITQSQSIDIANAHVLYELPYPGLLPGHPLYPLKELRDKILIFTTRDKQKKAQLYLHLSDKNMSTALKLADEGKEQAAIDQLMLGEERFLEIPELLINIKKQGGSFPPDFVQELHLSNDKHKEVITDVMKKNTQTEIETLDTLLQKNNAIRVELEKL